ncbi:HalOD1 output domain-containing protein [Natronomonas sp.]|uniref:HalOD1 output domain-containing protein n=1 Tax=Natronomonas sp. TaxID=2184060 RepID=UPI002FC313F2
MKNRGAKPTFSTDSLTVEIVNVLEELGIEHETYTLHDYVDIDALEELVASGNANIEVRITIEGIQLEITQHGVQALNWPSNARNSSFQQSSHAE